MATRLKDGLFLGDNMLAGDLEFIVTNKVTRIIACYDDGFHPMGSKALGAKRNGTIATEGLENLGIECLAFDVSSNRIKATGFVRFVNDAISNAQGVLFCDPNGFMLAALTGAMMYFMINYKWPLGQTLQFMQCKRPHDVSRLTERTTKQLLRLEKLMQNGDKNILQRESDDELVLRNTLANTFSQPRPIEKLEPNSNTNPCRERRIRWIDSPTHVRETGKVLHSPFSKRPIPERPPGASYRSLSPGNGWILQDEQAEANRSVEFRHANNNDDRETCEFRSILRGGKLWKQENRRMLKSQSVPIGALVRERLLRKGMLASDFRDEDDNGKQSLQMNKTRTTKAPVTKVKIPQDLHSGFPSKQKPRLVSRKHSTKNNSSSRPMTKQHPSLAIAPTRRKPRS